MKSNAKSSITLPYEELVLVEQLKARLHAKSNVDVIRQSLRLMKETTDRKQLRDAYRQASLATRAQLLKEIGELDHLAGEGFDE